MTPEYFADIKAVTSEKLSGAKKDQWLAFLADTDLTWTYLLVKQNSADLGSYVIKKAP